MQLGVPQLEVGAADPGSLVRLAMNQRPPPVGILERTAGLGRVFHKRGKQLSVHRLGIAGVAQPQRVEHPEGPSTFFVFSSFQRNAMFKICLGSRHKKSV